MSGAWGSGGYGSGSWGGGVRPTPPGGPAVAIRENVIVVEFEQAIFLTGLLEVEDASRVEKWTVTADTSTTGMSGDAARAVRVVRVELAGEADGIEEADYGRFVNLILDRPMTPFPAEYAVAWTSVFSEDLGTEYEGAAVALALYRKIEPPTIEAPGNSQDFANPQTTAMARDSLPEPTARNALGTFGMADDGDYALDQGIPSLKKRCLRRLMTRKNAFAHLPGYGVGVPDYAKKLATPATLSSLRAEAENQLSQEPDVQRVRVQIVSSPATPNLHRFRVAIQPKIGPSFAFDAPIDIST
jgi:hypothetical protein